MFDNERGKGEVMKSKKIYAVKQYGSYFIEYEIIFSFLSFSLAVRTRVRYGKKIEDMSRKISIISHSGIGWFRLENV